MNRAHFSPVLLVLMCLMAPDASGQRQASLGLGVSTARYAGGSHLSSAAISPSFELATPNLSATFAASLTSLPLGIWSSQARADAWTATPPIWGGLRFAGQGTWAGTTRSDGGWTAAAHGVAEVLWDGQTWGIGFGAGPSGGWISGQPPVAALHTRARAWRQVGPVNYAFAIEPTRFLGAWFTDASASLTRTTGSLTTSVWVVGRISSAYGSKAGGGALLQAFPVSSVALELGAGNYLADPYQGLPRAGYVTAGVRLFAGRRAAARAAIAPVWPPLAPERRDDSVVLRFRMEGAASVAIAGDWDRWNVHPLHAVGGDLWEGTLMLPPGMYRFTLLVDGKDWVVPGGVALERDRMGGMVAVLAVQ